MSQLESGITKPDPREIVEVKIVAIAMIGPHYELHVLYIHFTTYLSVRRPGISPQQQSSHLRIR